MNILFQHSGRCEATALVAALTAAAERYRLLEVERTARAYQAEEDRSLMRQQDDDYERMVEQERQRRRAAAAAEQDEAEAGGALGGGDGPASAPVAPKDAPDT